MTDAGFHQRYAAALHAFLVAREESSLAVGYELGRQALQQRISTLEIIENHSRLIGEFATTAPLDGAAALQFLLQTLAPLDVATRGFLDGTRRYQQERARANDLAVRDEFRSALVNSLQEGFFVADREGSVNEVNDAFAEITGFTADHLPYRWPYPWVADVDTAAQRLNALRRDGHIESETPIRHRDGHMAWVAVSMNAVPGADAYVGTIRDITATRSAMARESAVAGLATAVGVANSVSEVLAIALDEFRATIDVRRVVAVMWPAGDGEPTVQGAGEPDAPSWRDLDPEVQTTLAASRHRLPLTVEPVGCDDGTDRSRGVVVVLSGAGDVALWLEFNDARRFGAEDRLLVEVLVSHLNLAMQHVRQFEIARETSLTLQRAMLAPTATPPGFAVRYEPAVPPLEIGGDWYDVLPIGEHHIGIIVGDCVGRGLSAAAVMGQLRSSARALLLADAEPALLLEQLDAVAELIPGAFCTTVLVAIFDTESRVLTYSRAGHVPGLLVAPGPVATVLTGAGSVPLAVRTDTPRPQEYVVLSPGTTLMLFTDGLVERRTESIDDGIARVANVLIAEANSPVDAVAERVLRELAPEGGYDDDVAIVVCRPPISVLHFDDGATPDRLASVRARLDLWLRAAGTPDALRADVVLAVGEACTNSIEHAYRDDTHGTVHIEAGFEGDEIHVRVVDFGSWKTPPTDPGTRGRGLRLIKAVAESVALSPTSTGTTVEMTFRVPSTVSAAISS
jgi:PAS domain S-box-containing protein